MSLSNTDKASLIRRGLPITLHGLTFYPIKMSDYEQYIECKNALVLRMNSLPVKYQSKDYLSAIYALDMDSILEKGSPTGLFGSLMRFLYLSLRIGFEKMGDELKIAEKEIDGCKVLDFLIVTQDGLQRTILPSVFSNEIRPLLAQMNGLELPDESDNIDLVRDIEELKSQKQSVKLKANTNDLIASVAYLSHKSEREIDAWTVREFEARVSAIDRDKRYMLYAQAEMGGMVSFKNGNPVPSWCYDPIIDELENDGLEKINKAFGQQN